MKITVINPNTTRTMTEEIHKAARSAAAPGTEITSVTPIIGPESIECYHDHYAANLGVMSEVHKATREGSADGFVVACYGDPGVLACREITDAPVVGIAEASMYMACLVAAKFSIISVLDRENYELERMVHEYGMQRRCASIRATGLTVLETDSDPEKTMRELTRQSELAVLQDGAEALLLGCAGMVTFTRELEEKLGVPVFDGVIAAVKLVESLVFLGKRTSKIRTFSKPEQKTYLGMNAFLPY